MRPDDERWRLCIAPILLSWLSKDGGCASETMLQAGVESALAEPSIQEPGVKGVSTTGAVYDINLVRFAEEMLSLEISFCTYVT
jgi:hypothetical protein